MSSIAPRIFKHRWGWGPAREWWRGFAGATEPGELYFRFLAVFFGIWCFYDLLDLVWAGTAASYWLVRDAEQTLRLLRLLQGALFCTELGIVLAVVTGWRPRGLVLGLLCGAMLFRWIEVSYFFGLNDFYYYSITVLILIQFFPWGPREQDARLARWPRELLRYQTAWIYFATGLLKLNPHWLSGDHLWIRHQYMAQILQWPYPAWLLPWIARLETNHWLAVAGVAGELALAVSLAARLPRWMPIALAVGLHGFAALGLNVWFFGASMVAQVVFVTAKPAARGPG